MMREMQLSGNSRSRSRARGSSHLKKQMPVSDDIPKDYYSTSPELSRSSSKKSIGVPIKSLMEEEFAIKEKKTRHPSPGVVARLMGLDFLPSPPSPSLQNPNPNPTHRRKKSETLTNASSSHEKYIFTEDELPEFKDVFEISEARKSKKKLHKNSVPGGPGSPEMEFVLKKFAEAKRLSADQSLRSSREFNDVIEALESKKDILLEFLNKPNSLFAKHLKDLAVSPPGSPPRGASQITILKPSKRGVNLEVPKFENSRELRDSSHYRKHGNNLSNSSHSFEDDYVSLTFEKPIKSNKNKGKIEKNKSSNIVVLKPSLDKARNTINAGVFPIFYPETNESVVGPTREKSSREIAREITKQMRRNLSTNTTKKPSPLFDPNPLYETNNDSSLYDEWNYYNAPDSNPVESSVNKEARKRLSDRWRNSHRTDEMGPLANGFNTLGEIISKEKKSPKDDRDSSRGIFDNNINIYRNFSRSKSLPPKLGHKTSHHRRRGSRVSEFGLIKDVLDLGPKGITVISHDSQKDEKKEEDQSDLMEREIHVNSEEFEVNRVFNEEKIEIVGPPSSDNIPSEEKLIERDDDMAVPVPKDESDKREVVLESLVDGEEGEEQPSPNSVMEPPFEEVEDEQGDEEASTSECFEKINADLHELRMQLKLLKMGSTDEEEEQSNNLHLLSDEEETLNYVESGERNNQHDPQFFRDEEERDFSYLVDMLLNLGFQISNQDDLVHACHSLESPVSPTVFAKLERKYGDLVLWSRAERKILFDLVNSVLGEIIGTFWTDLRKKIWAFGPNWNGEEFIEVVWEKVVKEKRETEFEIEEIFVESKWSKDGLLRNGKDLVGKEIASILHDEILDELVFELISCY